VNWTTSDDIVVQARRRWTDGTLLSALARDDPFPVIAVPLRGPSAADLGDSLQSARAWVDDLDAGRMADTRYTLEWGAIGGRHFGRNRIPIRAVVSQYDQAWALLRVGATVKRFEGILDLTRSSPANEAILSWVIAHPHKALDLHGDWPAILAAHLWLDENRDSGHYLREISAPGVDTKFAEHHRGTLAAMLGVSSTAAGFAADLGLATKPEMIRLRVSPGLGLVAPLSEVAVRLDELSHLAIRPASVLVIENEVTYLSAPIPADGVVIWGQGFAVDRVGHLPWLADISIDYWGDLDTHGFAILNRLRHWLPHVRSVLMDRETLLAFRDRWGREDKPSSAALAWLTDAERDLYEDLVADRYGTSVRLEQERVDWSWATSKLSV